MKLIAIGSNIDPHEHVPAAIRRMAHRLPVLKVSPFVVTAPIDRPEQDDYWNGVVAIEWTGERTELALQLLELEQLAGRIRTDDPYEARTLDLDIVWWDDWMDDEVVERGFLRNAVLAIDPDAVVPSGRRLEDITVLAHPPGPIVWQWQTP